ncbi:hypothetical protein I6N96_01215 [Enterococcus sp. BWM-S5]|uniref:Uncharacterized protein n=1 Tax=Enterococcus larvae TaxID=2794352 RepID=A0ABS4CE56_9ENTE|nr:hypothetical protein [Enterococcus larvae]MBP1044881.1 hypothetical protein [Enterococcus larvae]
MKYTTRIILAVSIVAMTIICVTEFKSFQVFMMYVYPLIAGWFIGECLNIPEEKVRIKWRNFKDRVAIGIVNFASFLAGRR